MTRGRRLAFLLLLAAASLFACSEKHGSSSTAPPVTPALKLQSISTALSTPVFLTAPPADFTRLFVVEKPGRIRIIKNGSLLPTPFLDIHSQVSTDTEQGLLGLAFDPGYAANGRFYVSFSDLSWNEHVVRYHVSGNPDVADPTPLDSVLYTPHPDTNHNGGMLAFGPDGMLYASFGDGGGGGDTYHHSQTTDDLLGSISRMDVHNVPAVPAAGNPDFGAGARPEIWDIGLRNPWRFSFDRGTGDLYIGDVGQDDHEEIDISTAAGGGGKGANYGWNIMEAGECYPPGSACSSAGLTPPMLEYDHGEGCAVIGGYVYRGSALPGLLGTYFYGDNCAHWVRSFRLSGFTVTEKTDWPTLDPGSSITSFGEDARGEIYVLTLAGGVYKIVAQ
ncbi:MAG TPA: PQQ-dependent sugar dehydrogenase [Candidatus Sulfotelmatobacter sp.]|nr:PQQ-dependent sugar dehydrogenase [Candidatus Sulfotelmatobacter sp.]